MPAHRAKTRPWVRDSTALAVIPLALAVTALSASPAGNGAAVAGPVERPQPAEERPIRVAHEVAVPASYSDPRRLAAEISRSAAGQVEAVASADEIPTAALAAYQRAETAMNAADTSCHLPWELLAAIGRVESDHGRYRGNTLGRDGISRPGVYGTRLNGRNHTTEIRDTDAGRLDHDQVYDRAIGPMQFIPTTWSVVGVDADGDSQRNAQDIDDAALAAAVYLCWGADDLSTEAGQRTAVFRYNHSRTYVALVRSIAGAYEAGDFTAVPIHVASVNTHTPDNETNTGDDGGAPHGPTHDKPGKSDQGQDHHGHYSHHGSHGHDTPDWEAVVEPCALTPTSPAQPVPTQPVPTPGDPGTPVPPEPATPQAGDPVGTGEPSDPASTDPAAGPADSATTDGLAAEAPGCSGDASATPPPGTPPIAQSPTPPCPTDDQALPVGEEPLPVQECPGTSSATGTVPVLEPTA